MCPCLAGEKWCVFSFSVQQVFGLFKWRSPPPAYPSQRQRVDWSRKLCVCFYSSSYKVQPTERAHAGISKGAGRPPSSQRDNAGRRISHRPSYPWLYSAPTECFRSCLTGSKAAIVSSVCAFVCVRVRLCARALARGLSLRLYVPPLHSGVGVSSLSLF